MLVFVANHTIVADAVFFFFFGQMNQWSKDWMTNWTVTTPEGCVMVVIQNIVDRSYARLPTLKT